MPEPKKTSWLTSVIGNANVADEIDESVLGTIGMEVVKNYDLDVASRADWERKTEAAMNLAKQVREPKTLPSGDPCSNVKFPILTDAAIQFAARAYPELIKGTDVAKCQVTGRDTDNVKQDRADRIGIHMSWQLLKQMPEWSIDMDQALHTHPIIGGFCKKTYYSESLGRNVSELISLNDYVVNQNADRHNLRRESHRYWYYQNDLLEKMRSGLWLEYDLGEGSKKEDQGDTDIGHEIIEQHCFYDLDDDGYKEPWIITVHKVSTKVLRIVARFEEKDIKYNKKKEIVRIEPEKYFTVYRFFPDPAGGFYPLGLGQLLEPLNEAINTLLNQLIDAGTLANRAGGFIARGVNLKGGRHEVSPFKWQFVEVASGANLRDAIFPIPVREPSAVLFSLLGLLIDATRTLANTRDVLSGNAASLGKDASPTVVMAMIEQGLKVYTGIYKRFYDSLTEELRKLYRLNAIYLQPEESFVVSGEPYQVGQEDYREGDLEVLPVADPNMATDMQRQMRAQVLLKMSGRPGMNEVGLTRIAVKSLNSGEEDKVLLSDGVLKGEEPPPYKPMPNPAVMMAQAKMADVEIKAKKQTADLEEAAAKFRLDADRHQMELIALRAKIENLAADTMLKLATAEAKEAGQQLAEYKTQMDLLGQEVDRRLAMAQDLANRQAAMQQQTQEKPNAASNPGNVPAVA